MESRGGLHQGGTSMTTDSMLFNILTDLVPDGLHDRQGHVLKMMIFAGGVSHLALVESFSDTSEIL